MNLCQNENLGWLTFFVEKPVNDFIWLQSLDLCRYIYPSNKLSEAVLLSKPDRRKKKKIKDHHQRKNYQYCFSSNRATAHFSGHCNTQVTTTLQMIWHTHTNSDSPPISRGLFNISFWGLLQTKYLFSFCTSWVLFPNSFARKSVF